MLAYHRATTGAALWSLFITSVYVLTNKTLFYPRSDDRIRDGPVEYIPEKDKCLVRINLHMSKVCPNIHQARPAWVAFVLL